MVTARCVSGPTERTARAGGASTSPYRSGMNRHHQGSRYAGRSCSWAKRRGIGFALALFGGQVRHPRRVLLPLGMTVGLRIAEDRAIDADGRTGQDQSANPVGSCLPMLACSNSPQPPAPSPERPAPSPLPPARCPAANRNMF